MFLIIYAHPDSKSFNHAVLEQVKNTLEKRKKYLRKVEHIANNLK